MGLNKTEYHIDVVTKGKRACHWTQESSLVTFKVVNVTGSHTESRLMLKKPYILWLSTLSCTKVVMCIFI